MSLTQRLTEFISAAFTGLWIMSHEHDDALAEIARMCRNQNWRLATWDIASGLQIPGQNSPADAGSDPLAAIRSINALAVKDSSAILVLANFHKFLNSPEIIQALAKQISTGKQNRTFIVVLSPIVQIPIELEKLFCVVEHALPDRVQLEQIARQTATEPGELNEEQLPRILDAAAGMTRYEAEGAFSLCLVRQRPLDAAADWLPRLDPDVVFNMKAQAVAKSGLAKVYRGTESIDGLGGLTQVKHHLGLCASVTGEDQPKGLVLVGQPGVGKSHIAKAAGKILGRPVIMASLSQLKGPHVGDTGANTRRLLAIVRAVGKCVVVLDEGNQQLGGGAERHETTEEMIGELLTYLNDQQDAFFLLTANEIASLPDAFTRPGRFDGVYFVDLPGAQQREAIWSICLRKYKIEASQTRPSCDGWTGAEIDQCCKNARMYRMPWSRRPNSWCRSASARRTRSKPAGNGPTMPASTPRSRGTTSTPAARRRLPSRPASCGGPTRPTTDMAEDHLEQEKKPCQMGPASVASRSIRPAVAGTRSTVPFVSFAASG